MKVTCVGIKPTQDQKISLTPEQLAATGARYSRNNEGLEAILDATIRRCELEGLDEGRTVDSIFKMVDYGHRSIADMAPVAMFIDDISLWMALRLWQWCPTAGGQESSTRYVMLELDRIVQPPSTSQYFRSFVELSFKAYEEAYSLWTQIAERRPDVMGIPEDVTGKKLERMQRNFAFDRARYFLPMCCETNVMLMMQARGWVDLIKMLFSDLNAESVELAERMVVELEKVAPRLTKHARYDDSYADGIKYEFDKAVRIGCNLNDDYVRRYNKPVAYCEAWTPSNISDQDLVDSLMFHNNRYDYFGPAIRRTAVRFGWNALTIAELRDLNRHRTGTKEYSLVPVGSYFADDQIENIVEIDPSIASQISELRSEGERLTVTARQQLELGDPAFVYYLPLGAQCAYEHTTTADKFLYQCELRTGLGAHYTYAARMREVLELWHQRFPRTRTLIRPGTAEPE